MGFDNKNTISILFFLIIGILSFEGCQDYSKGAVFNNDGLSTELFEKSFQHLTWILSPRKLHKIRYSIKKASKDTELGDTVYVDLQSLFSEKIDRIYFYYGWRPAWLVAELMGVDYSASCIPEHVARIILISENRVIYHEDIPRESESGLKLVEGYDSEVSNYEGRFSTTVGVSPTKISYWEDTAIDFYNMEIKPLDKPVLVEYCFTKVIFFGNDMEFPYE